jgi:hypothetical protein
LEKDFSVQGRIPYDQWHMPATWNFDFSLGKNFSVTERYHLIFPAEMLNVFNLVNFAAPSLRFEQPDKFWRVHHAVQSGAALPAGPEIPILASQS